MARQRPQFAGMSARGKASTPLNRLLCRPALSTVRREAMLGIHFHQMDTLFYLLFGSFRGLKPRIDRRPLTVSLGVCAIIPAIF
jgi:hypothetical protein